MRDVLPEIIAIIVMTLLVIALFFGVYKLSIKHDNEVWNGGHCNTCGGTWEYEQAVGHRAITSYIYVCENCGKRIEISEIR